MYLETGPAELRPFPFKSPRLRAVAEQEHARVIAAHLDAEEHASEQVALRAAAPTTQAMGPSSRLGGA
jgi:hypothetical protein